MPDGMQPHFARWPYCGWPAGCRTRARDGICTVHRSQALTRGHDPQPVANALAGHAWLLCKVCGIRVGMHGALAPMDEAAAVVWLEDHPEDVRSTT